MYMIAEDKHVSIIVTLDGLEPINPYADSKRASSLHLLALSVHPHGPWPQCHHGTRADKHRE
jgi:hypothetical protein